MTLYGLAKFVHVLAAIAWVGGVIATTVLGARASREPDVDAAAAVSRQTAELGRVLLGPAAGLTLVAGIVTAVVGGIPMSTLWIVWGYAGVLASMVLGATVLQRTGVELAAVVAADGPAAVCADGLRRRLGRLGLVNLLILVSVVWAMVAKPTL